MESEKKTTTEQTFLTVTQRARSVKQPYGGYVSIKEFELIKYEDNKKLYDLSEENLSPTMVGTVVEYFSRILSGATVERAFQKALLGARFAEEEYGKKGYCSDAIQCCENINRRLDNKSIINACKLYTFETWVLFPDIAQNYKSHKDINPNKETLYNIRVMLNRSKTFLKEYGPIVDFEFSFTPEHLYNTVMKPIRDVSYNSSINLMHGGYTETVKNGVGDFLTKDTIWDYKVSVKRPQKLQTLQLLMYWIMGHHSGKQKFENIDKVGMFNPRLNEVYLLDMNKVSKEIIKEIEDNVICY